MEVLATSSDLSLETVPSPAPTSTFRGERRLLGCESFVRHNPQSDKFEIRRFHHVEFYCADATSVSRRFMYGLGFNLLAKSDLSTG
jgi:4-hydroxyphenylpyruvate dioxygenase